MVGQLETLFVDAPVQSSPIHRQNGVVDLDALRSTLTQLVEEGKTNPKIGEVLGVSRETVRKYVGRTGLTELQKKRRAEIKEKLLEGRCAKKQAMQELHSLVCARRRTLAQQAGWAIEKAVEYYHTLQSESRAGHSFQKLVHFFEQYGEAQRQGSTPGLRELGAAIEISAAEAGHILRDVGLTPFHTTWPYKPRVPPGTLIRAFSLPLSAMDIAYFLNVSSIAVHAQWKKIGQRPIYYSKVIAGCSHLSYRTASQIYQVDDWRLPDGTPENLASLLGTKPAVINYAREHRPEIAPIIVHALQTLFPEKRVFTPYLS